MPIRDLIIRQLEEHPLILEDLIASIPPARLDYEFGGDVWTVHEHLQHLALTQIMLMKRIQTLIKEERPTIVPYQPDSAAGKSAGALKPAAELLGTYAEWRSRQVAALRRADDAVWKKPVLHPEYAAYDFHIAVRHILLHDGFHFHRIEELGFLKPENVTPM